MHDDRSLQVPDEVPPRIGDYEIGPELGRGAMSTVYRGTRGDRVCAIKLMNADMASESLETRLQFRREAAATARLEHPALVRVLEVGEAGGRPYLVMELAEGENLSKRLENSRLNDVEAEALARAIAGALVEVHRFGLIHRDIKPANIVMSPTAGARLIDFGLVSSAANAEMVVGTMHYASPEQVGLLKRAVGAPGDLYSLGVTLYESLAGALPFAGESLADFLHQLSTMPAPDLRVVRPETRPAFAAIIAKLLAKDPDDRYQTARGLLADLSSLGSLDETLRNGGAVALGTCDNAVTRDQEAPLIGRKTEMANLNRAWKRASTGTLTFALLEGEGGSGKTRLASELIARATAQGAVVLVGECQELETVPFGALREAAEQYAARVLRMPAQQREEAVENLRWAAGEWAPLVKRFAVGLGRLLGETPEIRALEPDAEQQRYFQALASFFGNLGTAAAPLLLVIDDIQWLDAGSLRVLDRLADGATQAHLLVLATARNNAGYEAARARFDDAIGDGLFERIELQPLPPDAVEKLITALLGGRPLDAPTVGKLAALTRGNPFGLSQYLRALLESGVVRPIAGQWFADPGEFDAVKLPKDVVELVVERLRMLSPEASRLVAIAGVIGGRFAFDLLAQVAGTDPEALARSIEEMVHAGLLERGYPGTYAFIHDRVREAAVDRLSVTERRDVHQAIAEALDATQDPSLIDIYALARHCAEGHRDRNPERVAETNLRAGLWALEQHANEEAFELLDLALDMAQRAGIYDRVAMQLLEGLGRACAMTGRLDRAFAHLEEALRLARDHGDRFRLHYLLTLTYASQGRNDDALKALFSAYDVLGRPFPRGNVMRVVHLLGVWVLALVLRWTGIGYGRAREEERDRRQTLSQLNYAGSMIALFQGSPLLMVQFVVRDFYNVHFLGPTAETAIASSVYGAVLGTFKLTSVMQRYTRLGVGMAEQLGDRAALSVCRAYQAVGTKWAGDLVRGNEMLIKALPDLHRYVPGSWYAAMMICEQAYSYLHAGQSLAAIEHVRANAVQLERTNNLMFRYNTMSVQSAEMMVSGDVVAASESWARLETQFQTLRDTIYVRLARCIAVLELLVDGEETGPNVDEAVDAFHDLVSEDYYSNAARMLAGYARLAQFQRARPEDRPVARRKLVQAVRALSIRVPPPVFRCHTFVWRAALARADGKLGRARLFLDRAERLATQCNSRRCAYHVALERARLGRQAGDSAASFLAAQALEIAVSERWRAKAGRVRNEFGIAEARTVHSLDTTLTAQRAISHADNQARRYAEALLQVSLASASTLDLEVQAKNALVEVARVLGAERALFFLVDEATGEMTLKASTGAGAESISHTVVRKVLETRSPVVLAGTDDGEVSQSMSIMTYGLRSIMAVPLMLRDRLLGVVYLDSRLAKGMFGEDDLMLLLGVANHIAIAIETARTARFEVDRMSMERDLELLGIVQSLLMPKEHSFSAPGFRGAGFHQPASKCGGDWWWFDIQADGSLLLLLGDVSGHGAAPAMITGVVVGAFRAIRKLLPDATPPEILAQIDHQLRAFDGAFHMTLSAVLIEPRLARLTWWNAAAPAIFVLRPDGCACIASRGQVLGDACAFQVPEFSVPFHPGDRLLVCTDGLLEVRGPDGRDFGTRRVGRMFADLAGVPVGEVTARMSAHVNQVLAGRDQEDDITFAVVEATTWSAQGRADPSQQPSEKPS